MAIAYVGSTANNASATTVTVTRTTSTGNLLVLGIARPSAVSSIVDTAGNTWKSLTDTAAASATSPRTIGMYYCPNAASITSVTITVASTGSLVASLIEISGAELVTPLEGYQQTIATSTTMNSTSTITPAVASTYLLVAFGGYQEVTSGTRLDTLTAGTNITGLTTAAVSANGTTALAAAYGTNTNTSAPILSWTLSASTAWGACVAMFKPPLAAQSTMGLAYEDFIAGMTPSSWSPAAISSGDVWTGTYTKSIVQAVAPHTAGQLWPRGSKGDSTSS